MKPIVLLLAALALAGATVLASEEKKTMEIKTEFAVLGGGCFWCMDAAYRLLPGVMNVTCGYAGGTQANPTYEEVSAHRTGHAEVIKIDFDPERTSLEQLLDYFWQVHDPTQVGGQGHDEGSQYRSIILYADAAQQAAAEKSRAAAQKRFRAPLTTEIVPLTKFWPAEDYHQDYFRKNPNAGYCRIVIAPKLRKLEQELGIATK